MRKRLFVRRVLRAHHLFADIGHHGATHLARASLAPGEAEPPTRLAIAFSYRGHDPLPPRPCSSVIAGHARDGKAATVIGAHQQNRTQERSWAAFPRWRGWTIKFFCRHIAPGAGLLHGLPADVDALSVGARPPGRCRCRLSGRQGAAGGQTLERNSNQFKKILAGERFIMSDGSGRVTRRGKTIARWTGLLQTRPALHSRFHGMASTSSVTQRGRVTAQTRAPGPVDRSG